VRYWFPFSPCFLVSSILIFQLHSYVLPIMQGYYQISTIPIPREPVLHESGSCALADYIVVSRRSRDRAGLRYQRRGVDEDAHVANFVESESVLRVEREWGVNVFSYVQIRGSSELLLLSWLFFFGLFSVSVSFSWPSCGATYLLSLPVPLFWTQSGYSLKPPPLLSPERTHDQNFDALKRHFDRTIPKYGPLVRPSLLNPNHTLDILNSYDFFGSLLSIWRNTKGKKGLSRMPIGIM